MRTQGIPHQMPLSERIVFFGIFSQLFLGTRFHSYFCCMQIHEMVLPYHHDSLAHSAEILHRKYRIFSICVCVGVCVWVGVNSFRLYDNHSAHYYIIVITPGQCTFYLPNFKAICACTYVPPNGTYKNAYEKHENIIMNIKRVIKPEYGCFFSVGVTLQQFCLLFTCRPIFH